MCGAAAPVMGLRRALGWAGAQTGVRIALGFASAKVSAIYLGPAGMALVGQLGSFIQVMQGAIGNGAGTAVVNLTAERIGHAESHHILWGTALSLVLAVAIVLAIVVALASSTVASRILGDSQFWPAIILAALAAVLVVADTVILSALNGLKQVNLIAKAGIASAVAEISVFAMFVYGFGLWGGLIGMAAIYVVKLAVTCVAAFGSGLVSPRAFSGAFDFGTAREIARFYPMLLVHSIALPLAQILVRDGVIDGLGLEQAGYLQAVWRLSDMYIGVMTMALGMYFMAHFSATTEEAERGALLRRTVLQLAALTLAAASLVYALRDFVIHVVLTAHFLPMGELMPLHLLGDVFKMMHYPLQMALVAQRRISWYVVLAAGGPMLFLALSHAWLPGFGAQAAPAAYAASYFAVLCFLLLAQRKTLAATKPKR